MYVSWFHDGSEVINTTTRKVLSQTGTSFKNVTLIFDPAMIEDAGNYKCISTLTLSGSHELLFSVNDTIEVGLGTIGMSQ